jgi:hypothetical protein
VALGALLLVPRWNASVSTRLRAVGALMVATTAFLVPWAARNWAFTGNPLAPALQSVFSGPGREYFDPLALDQVQAFVRAIGMGRSLTALVTLPWNLTMNIVPGVYGNSYGYQIGPLYFVLALAVLLVTPARRDPLASLFLELSGLLVLLWFLTVQESRLLLSALSMLAVAGATAIDELVPRRPSAGSLLLVLPLYVAPYGAWWRFERFATHWAYAVGPLDAEEIAAREPAHVVGRWLATNLAPRDRVLLVFESRGYLFQGTDYIPAVINEGSAVLQLIHRAPDVRALRCQLESLGVTIAVVNENNLQRFPPAFVDAYHEEDLRRDVALIHELLETSTTTLLSRSGVRAARLRPVVVSPSFPYTSGR